MSDQDVWGLHCSEGLDLVGGGFAALGWDEMGDLAPLPATYDTFKVAVAEKYPDAKAGAIPQWASQLYRFVHVVKDGDLIVYRERGGGPINLGLISGPYACASGEVFSQRRPVKWVKTGLDPTQFEPGPLFELGAFLTLFRIKNYPAVWLGLVDGKVPPSAVADGKPPDPSLDAAKINQGTRDFLLKRLSQAFSGHPFAHLTGAVLERLGYTCEVSPEGPDGGVDVLAYRGRLGLEPPLIKVQAKSSSGSVGAPTVSELGGRINQAGETGLFVTLGTYSKDALKYAASRADLHLVKGSEFLDLFLEHYDELPDEFRSKVPLQRVWARDLQGEADESGE